MNNLDTLAAQCAQEIVRERAPDGSDAKKRATALENMATKALGVLQENGVFAGMLFLYSKKEDEDARALRDRLLGILNCPEMAQFDLALPDTDRREWQKVSEHLTSQVCADLDTLLLVKQVWEQTLIYVRYGAKARG